MMTIYGREINDEDMANIATYMDDGIREDLHSDLAPCSYELFLRAYLYKDPELREVLEREFDFIDNGQHEEKLFMNFDVGVFYTLDELKENYELYKNDLYYDSFEEYMEDQLSRGKEKSGGFIEIE